jgi:hypothetical protein
MKQKKLILLLVLFLLLSFPVISQAITVTAAPNPAYVGQNISVTVNVVVGIPCSIDIDYGDNTGTSFFCSQSCINTTSHMYSVPGTYTITASGSQNCNANPPNPATYSVTILQQCPQLSFITPSALPSATTGQAYTYQLQTSGGQPPVTYNLISGALPPGLILNASGLISGAPVSPGNYSFTVEATDSCIPQAQTAQMTFFLDVSTSSVSLNLIPSFANIPRNTASAVNVVYSFTSTPPSDVNLRSDKGVFLAGNSVIGEDPIPLTVSVINGTGSVSEALNIPVAISKRAEALGTNRITYTRTFYNQNTQTQVSGQMTLNLTTEALAEFKINRLQLYFENKRAETTIKRNYPSLKAYADIRFTGSGLLQGYWEVDGRILSHIHMHLVYGRNMILETPEIPPLPTFDDGTHRLRLVITSPLLDIPMPEAIYFVTSEDYKFAPFHIDLVSPDDAVELAYSPVVFRWEGKDVTVAYLIEFFEKGDEKPIFSAYTRKVEYNIPNPILKQLFMPGKAYRWKVKGFDTETNIIGESFVNDFIFRED